MREILFRGRTLDGFAWAEGYLVHRTEYYGESCNEYFIVAEGDFDYDEYDSVQVDPETVGQFTGMRDCKRTAESPEGQMIFEGDVIKVERDLHCGENKKEREIFNGVVWYDDKHTCFGIKSKKYRCLPIHRFKGDYSAIIGNIHDNPELLKEGGE